MMDARHDPRTIERTTNMKMNIEFLDPSSATVEIPKTDAYIKSTMVLSDKVDALNLPSPQHEKFAYDLVDHIEITRQEAFGSGFAMGVKFGLDTAGITKKEGKNGRA